ncbi:MAG TPA: hypothetical protein VLD58_10690 [Gemmatimonadales bacterium]|nr:hypothetical protein [Gemmatimonadales bacterium]
MRWHLAGTGLLLTIGASPLSGQAWNDSTVLALVERGITAREQARPDSALASYSAQAHGFVFFLGQAGRDLEGTPRLIKADELEVEVYWRAPGTSKQVILGWRDGRWLPTDINYHRDHLGVVTNNFGDRIRIGDGDEVKDVPHPLAPDGPALYDYRLGDSVRMRGRGGEPLLVQEVEVRPRSLDSARVVGTLSLDVATGDLLRFRFSFTPSAYLDSSLEDISITLESARVERWWLPSRQEIEIRRRVSWFDFPARSIIRGRWEIGNYDLNPAIPSSALRGPSIGGLRRPDPRGYAWSAPLADLVREQATPVEKQDLEQVRSEIQSIVEGRMLNGLPRARPGVTSLSDLAHVNRVQGLALGFGAGIRALPRVMLRPRIGFGTSDERLTGDLTATWEKGGSVVTLYGGRRLADLEDEPRRSTLANSLLAQEGGRDLGDYVRLDRVSLGGAFRRSPAVTLRLEAGLEWTHSVSTEASPARGSYRPNPPLGIGRIGVGRIGFRYASPRLDRNAGAWLAGSFEGGTGAAEYGRVNLTGALERPAGPGTFRLRLEGGAGTEQLPPYRSFAVGGWGTLLGEPFRAWGGRRYGLGKVAYGLPVPFPALPLGAFVSTGNRLTVAPFVAVGWAGARVTGMPWVPSAKVRPVAGLGLEWFHGLIRFEGGASLRTGKVGFSLDVAPEWWDIL